MAGTRFEVKLIALLKADARAIPLKDESVDCVLTSPPYWGLRDYGLKPSAWGGRNDCAHQWEDVGTREGYSSKARWQHSENGRGEEQPTDKRLRDPVTRQTRPEAWTQLTAGATCTLCGAWSGALGLEPSLEMYLEHVLLVAQEIRRVLKPTGLLWLNMGDCYATGAGRVGDCPGGGEQGERWKGYRGGHSMEQAGKHGKLVANMRPLTQPNRMPQVGLKPKDLVGMPWRVALALQKAGWWLRSDIVWSKRNPMPESVRDRPTRSHEYIFMLAKAERYYFAADAVREPHVWLGQNRYADPSAHRYHKEGLGPNLPRHAGLHKANQQRGFDSRPPIPGQRVRRSKTAADLREDHLRKAPEPGNPGAFHPNGRNIRSVWHFSTQPYRGAHFATFPEELARRCILAGCPPGGTVLDPFAGSGTVGKVTLENGRSAVLCDLRYQDLQRKRIAAVQVALPFGADKKATTASQAEPG